jgi:hypothetical protein
MVAVQTGIALYVQWDSSCDFEDLKPNVVRDERKAPRCIARHCVQMSNASGCLLQTEFVGLWKEKLVEPRIASCDL